MSKHLLVWLFLGALSTPLPAAEVITSAAGFTFPSIEDGAGARAVAMGSTYVGVAEGSASLLWNPAGLGTLLDPEIAEHHNAALVGASQDIAVVGLPLGNGNGLGVSLNYEGDGNFDGRDVNGVETGGYSANAYGGSVGWGVGLMDGLNVGLDVKFNQENLAGTALNAFAGDLGMLWNIIPQLSLGVAYNNLGPSVAGWQLDQGIRAGLSSYFYKGDTSLWLAALSMESFTNGDSSLHFGLEDTLFKFVSVRAGYSVDTSVSNPDTSNLLGWTFGLGVMIHKLSIDYAYVPMSDLGATQRVSLTYDFGCRCLNAPVATLIPDETIVVLNDQDFGNAATGNGKEELTKEAQSHLYQALTEISGVKGASLRVNGESSRLRHPDTTGNGPELRQLGDSRSEIVCAYIRGEMPRARVNSGLTRGEEKDASASLFEVVVR